MSSSGGASETDIAIIGIAAHLPDAFGPEQFWKNLRAGVESVRAFSTEELAAAGVSAKELADPAYVRSGIVLPEMEHFDAEFFGFSPKEAAILDPQHRHFLECAWEALEDAGHTPESFAGSIGVFGGCGMGAYFAFNLLSNPSLVESVGLFLLRHTGNDKDFLATRVSYCLDLRGPSVNVQTACSTSLVAVHLAAQSLLNAECDMALAGGVTIEIPHRRGYAFKPGEILSPDGHCRAFDHRAQGTVFGSGAGIVVLRRLDDALADGDHVYAVIKGSAVNNDGAGKIGYLAPSVDGQAAAIAEALALAGVHADTIDYVEAHGTGTAMGDPIEVAALAQAFRQTTAARGFCALGSLKTNIGHLDTAAGVASLIKVALALERGEIPPSLNYEAPNPSIDFEKSPFFVASTLRPWKRSGRPRRAGVNSLGVGGTNAHVIVEEAPAPRDGRVTATGPANGAANGAANGPETGSRQRYPLLVLSAKSREALDASSRRLAEHLREHPEVELADVAWTLQVGRRAFAHRRVLATASVAEAATLLEANDLRRVFTHMARAQPTSAQATSAVFLFPGGGTQHPRMAFDLHAREPVFRQHVERGIDLLRTRTGHDLRPLFFAEPAQVAEAAELFRRPALQLPALFIVEHALAQLWISLGVRPAALIGHSLGENTAACVAGVLSYEDALGLVALRGELFERLSGGGMLSVALGEDALVPLLGSDLDLAAVNAPKLCVASGPATALAELARVLGERGVETKEIPITIAAHSRNLEPILGEFRAYLERVELAPPKIPIVSNRTGTWLTDREATSPAYWVDHLRHTIRFSAGLETVLADPARVLIECGPGKTLSSLARAQRGFSPASHHAIASLRHAEEEIADDAFFATAFGRAWAAGIAVDLRVLSHGERRRRVSLPTYAFQRKRYWIEPGRPTVAAVRGADELPQKIPDLDAWFHRPVWRERATLPAVLGKTSWLLFADDAGIATRLAVRLRARGDEVVFVEPGDGFCKLGPLTYTLAPEHGREGYDALVADLVASGAWPDRVVHLWMVTARESYRPGSSFFHRNQEHGFYSLFFLAQALAGESRSAPLHLAVVSNGMQAVGEETLPHPDKATVLGACKVIPRELAHVTCASIDLALPAARKARRARGGLDTITDRLLAELLQPPANTVVAWRESRRFVEEHERTALPRGENGHARKIRERGVYLITGGLGGIGLALAEHFARRAHAGLVLVSRNGLPDRATWDERLRSFDEHAPEVRRIRAVRALEALGAEVELVAADVTDVEALAEGISRAERRFGPLAGVVHAAGVVADAPLQAKTQADVEDVFTSKVHGTLVLDELLSGRTLDFFVVFSSTSAISGPAGQIDYAAANAFLEAWARSQPEARHATSIAWGIWSEVGMAAEAVNEGQRSVRAQRTRHPLFEARRESAQGGVTLSARWSSTTHWLFDEHRTARGEALIPGTGYLEVARAALAEIGEVRPFEIRDLVFLRPLAVADGASLEARVQLQSASEGFACSIESRATLPDGRSGWRAHAQARLLLRELSPPVRIDLAAIERRCDRSRQADAGGIRTRQEEHLRFGPRWRVLHSIAYGAQEALAELALPDEFAGDLDTFALHPALLDLATSGALDLIEGYAGSRDLWVPVSYGRIRVHAALSVRIYSWIRLRAGEAGNETASFDVKITDAEGRVLVDVEGFSVRRIPGGSFHALAAPTVSELVFDREEGARELSPGEIALRHNLSQGILPAEGIECFERVLASGLTRVVASSLDLGALARQAETTAAVRTDGAAKFARPEIASEYVAPRDGIERTLVGFWEELLGVDQVGVRDGFFDLGGHSLIAVRLFARIKKAFHVDWPISILFEAPTIEACAERIRASTGGGAASGAEVEQPRYAHLVAMHTGRGGERAPFFLVAGMFGNVLNLRHLAHLVGADRRFYGLQARGLYGDHAPHEAFEEMARDYLVEVQSVQPHGPYLLGGFSGGGITAWEMARQLRVQGKDVALLALLDTPLPQAPRLSAHEKVRIHLQRVRRQGPSYLTDWVQSRVRWELAKRQQNGATNGHSRASDFRSDVIEAAFRRALDGYRVEWQPGTVTLFRPKLDRAHVLAPGRVTNRAREFVFEDNGWGPFCPEVVVHEVPGDHDGMVLEPNVRVLATKLRRTLDQAERVRAEKASG